jgi:hypothetical protein
VDLNSGKLVADVFVLLLAKMLIQGGAKARHRRGKRDSLKVEAVVDRDIAE